MRQLALLATIPVLWGSVGGLAYIAHRISYQTVAGNAFPIIIVCFALGGGLMRWTGELVRRIIELSQDERTTTVRMEQ